jgi:DNA topoisomerase I
MAKNLVIVESPAKAKTINKLLGGEFVVKASMGHVRDLPERALGVDLEKNFAPQYVPIKGRAKVLAELQGIAEKCERVFLAPDPDREGEAIAWHLREALRGKDSNDKFCRVTYNEITAPAIRKAFGNPGEINQRRVDSQQARRILDRVVGYKVSPMLWRRIPGASSAGRVQSVALRLVCEREKIIRDFQPEPYWVLGVKAAKRIGSPRPVYRHPGEAQRREGGGQGRGAGAAPDGGTEAARAAGRRCGPQGAPQECPAAVHHQQPAAGRQRALGLFAVAHHAHRPEALRRRGSRARIGLGLDHLHAHGFVHHRQGGREQARDFIEKDHGAEFLPGTPNVFRNRSSAQEAHEAIRPTDPACTPDSLKEILERDDWRLYDLIWRRFMASQMAPARIAQRTAEIEAVGGADAGPDTFLFRATASEIVFPGFMRVSGLEQRKKEEAENAENGEVESLPPLEKAEGLDVAEWLNDRKETQPPPRFTEASLVKVLEENGVGRPSTYAQIISTLLGRKYVDREKRALVPSDLGMKVWDFLAANLDALFDVQFTAGMEEQLDEIEEGQVAWTDMLATFYEKFQAWMGAARGPEADLGAVEKMLAALAPVVDWQPPVKRGAKTVYSDEKFVESVRKQFGEKKRPISGRQQEALAKLIFRYQKQVPNAEELIRDLKLEVSPEEVERSQPPRQETTAKLALLETIEFDPPRKFGKKIYDDKDFCASLRKQVEGGQAAVACPDRLSRQDPAQIRQADSQLRAAGGAPGARGRAAAAAGRAAR